MKKVALLVIVMVLVGSLGFAANKLDTMPVMLNDCGVRVLLDKAVIQKTYLSDEDTVLTLYVVVDNQNDKDLELTNTSTVFDDWEVDSNCFIEVKARKKKKDTITVHYEQAMLDSLSDVNIMTVPFNVFLGGDIFDAQHPDSKPVSGKWLKQNLIMEK